MRKKDLKEMTKEWLENVKPQIKKEWRGRRKELQDLLWLEVVEENCGGFFYYRIEIDSSNSRSCSPYVILIKGGKVNKYQQN